MLKRDCSERDVAVRSLGPGSVSPLNQFWCFESVWNPSHWDIDTNQIKILTIAFWLLLRNIRFESFKSVKCIALPLRSRLNRSQSDGIRIDSWKEIREYSLWERGRGPDWSYFIWKILRDSLKDSRSEDELVSLVINRSSPSDVVGVIFQSAAR